MNSKAQHYIKSAWNNFRHNKWYVSLMVLSLAIGMFCFIIASVYVNFEYSRNSNHKDADRVFRLMVEMEKDGRHTYLPFSFASEIAQRHSEIEAVSLMDGVRNDLYLSINKQDYILESSAYYADAGFFDVFTFPLKYGNEETALNDLNNIVISSSLSDKLFKGEYPIGKTIYIHEKGDFFVSGVFDQVSPQSLLKPGILFSHELLFAEQPERKGARTNFTHVKAMPNVSQEELQASLFETYRSLFPEGEFKGIYSEKLMDAYWGYSYYDYADGVQHPSFSGADKSMINSIGYIALGIMLCAVIGYLSLSLGLSLKRSKEIGVRKVNGAGRYDIQKQLLMESVFYSFFASLITVVALEVASDFLTQLFGVPIGIEYSQYGLLLKLMLFSLITGILSGIYPALVISKLNPVKILSGYSSPQGSGFVLKRVLLVVQLVVTVVLVFGTLVQVQQVNKMLDFDFGYNKQSLFAFQIDRDSKISANYTAVMNEIRSLDGVLETSGGPFPFTINGYWNLKYDNGDTLIEDQVGLVYVATNYFDLMQIPLVEGKDFTSPEESSLTNSCIINEALARQLGGNVVGQMINYGNVNRTIIGVSKDYTDWGISSPDADPRVFVASNKNSFHSILVKHDGQHINEIESGMEGIWRSYESVLAPEITNLETEVDYSTAGVKRSAKLYGFLSTMVLILSMMNLLGYSVMYAGSKLKNISIRRILGADVMQLFIKLSNPFLIVLVFSLMIALPVAYYIMEEYLNDYNVRIDLNWTYGAWVSLSMLILLFLVIGYQLLKVSRVNPVTVLKDE